ncbi:hypothetical protein EJB05_57413, partial [Eragrostis curvula]
METLAPHSQIPETPPSCTRGALINVYIPMDRQYSALTTIGCGVLALNSGLAIYKSWGDVGSVAFVLAADAALVLLFLCFREFERAARARGRNIKVAVWTLTTLLTVIFASRVAHAAGRVRGGLGDGGGHGRRRLLGLLFESMRRLFLPWTLPPVSGLQYVAG